MAKKVYLSPSTQEKNIGVNNYGTEEYRCNLIADIVESELERHGIQTKRNKPNMSLYDVKTDSNNYNPDLHVAIHTNAFNKVSRGCEVFCWKKGINSTGEKLANNIYAEIARLTPTNDRGVKEARNFYGPGRHMYEVWKTNAPAALVEVAFHDNKDDAIWIINNIEKIAIAIAKSILKTLKIAYVKPQVTGSVYRVIAGSYKDVANAKKQVNLLKSLGIESFVSLYNVED